MVMSIFRVLFGLIAANLVAGVVQVLFVITPAELMTLGGDALIERLQSAGILVLFAASQSAVFSAPLALIAIALAEWQRIRSIFFYVALGLAVAGSGFLAQYMGEGGATTIVNTYALTAYATTGFVAGIVFGWVAGRGAGGRRAAKTA
jgi:hypothetical protein